MSLSTMLWQVNGVDMKTPSTYKIDAEDLDLDSYRSVTNGNLIRNIIGKKWYKIGMSWNLLNYNQVQTIINEVNQNNPTFRFKNPAFGTNDWVEFVGYVSKFSCELLQGQVGWTLSFNVVQSERSSFQ